MHNDVLIHDIIMQTSCNGGSNCELNLRQIQILQPKEKGAKFETIMKAL